MQLTCRHLLPLLLGVAGCAVTAGPSDFGPGSTDGKADGADGPDLAEVIDCRSAGVLEVVAQPLDPQTIDGFVTSYDLPVPSRGPSDEGVFHPPDGYTEGGAFTVADDALGTPARASHVVPLRDGGFLRVAVWNVGRGEQLDTLIMRMREVDADVWLVNEADLYGHLTEQRLAAREMAKALGYAYVATTEFYERLEERHGTSGNAILSRYPLFDARRVDLPILADQGGYDWATSNSQPRCGQRSALAARAEVPNARGGTTVVNFVSAHLENKANGAVRYAQYEAARDLLTVPGEAAILGGDFNTWRPFEGESFRRKLLEEIEQEGGTALAGSPHAFMDCARGDHEGTHFIGRLDWVLLQTGSDAIACLPGSYMVSPGTGSDHDIVITDVFIR
jgi:endonuclease/exonuclease/phosphatase family metal-dependent hydrolase